MLRNSWEPVSSIVSNYIQEQFQHMLKQKLLKKVV